MFHEKGYDNGTLDDVADALDLRRASLYYYVQSKANLLNMVFQRGLDVALAEFEEILKIEDPAARLEALIRRHVEIIAGEPTLFSVFFDHRTRLEPQYEQEIRLRERRYVDAFEQAVRAAVAAGVLEAAKPEYTTQAIFGMITWCYKWFRADRHNINQFADACVQLVLQPEADRRRTPRPARRRN